MSVALVLIPQSIAYATIAGLPPEAGLFAATLPLIVAAPFVSCPWLQTGPVALTSLLTFGALSSIEFADEQEMFAAGALLAVIVGATRLLLGVRKLGGFTKLLSQPVVLGFTTAAAILIISSQLSKTLGCTNEQENVLHRALVSLCQPGTWNGYAILLSLFAAAIAWYGRKLHRLFPSIFVAVVLAILLSKLLPAAGPVVGSLPGGFISPNLDLPFHKMGSLLFPGIIIALVGFAEPASISKTFMAEENLEWDPNQELCGGGFANMVSGLIGGYPVGGSFSRTSINKFAGATSSWSGLITGAIVLATLWATPVLKSLPQAALGAIIIVAVVRLLKFKAIWQMACENWIYGFVAVATLAATLASTPRVDIGILIGAAIGLAVTTWEKSLPQAAEKSNDGEQQ